MTSSLKPIGLIAQVHKILQFETVYIVCICKIQMNNDLEWQKVFQWAQNETTYIINLMTDSQQISIEVEDKYTGDIWHSIFSAAGIEELTTKAKNPKKYAVFTKMLISAFLKTSDSLLVEIMSYREMNNKFGKPGSQSKIITPEQASKRFLLLTYVGEFEKMQFPLPLMYFSEVSSSRLKLTIKRLSQEINMLREGQSEEDIIKQNALLKYQNESLKNKVKSTSKMESSMILQPKIQELERELREQANQISSLQKKLADSEKARKDSEKQLKQKQEKIIDLQEAIGKLENQHTQRSKSKKVMNYYEQKIEEMINQMNDLSAELTYSREKEKKAELKITTLQKELQKMMVSKRSNQRKSISNLRESSPEDKKSEKSISVKSGRSNNSQKSLTKTRNINRKTYNVFGNQNSNINNSNSKKQLSNRKSSIYDSDTESSRLRKMANGRSSPYRQTNNANSKKNQPKPSNPRSRSKSKERVASPKPSLVIQSQMMTEGYQSDSSEDEELDRIEGYLKDLKQRKGAKNTAATTKPNTSNAGTKIQKRLQTLQQMIRKTALSTRNKH